MSTKLDLSTVRLVETLCKCFGCETRFVHAEPARADSGLYCCPRCGPSHMVETYGECLTDEQAADWMARAF